MSSGEASTQRIPGLPDLIPRIPEYELLRCIGAGGYGRVFLARNSLGGYCAVKVVWHAAAPDDKSYERELNGLRHFADISRLEAGFVDVLHIGRNDQEGYFYYVMELGDPIDGKAPLDPDTYIPKTLQRELDRRKALPPTECIRLGISLCSALAFLHNRGLVHRDIKPANIIFIHGVPRLADPGLVTLINSQISAVGTLEFMDPATHGQKLGDIYSLGRVLYVAATGLTAHEYPSLPTMAEDNMRDFLELNEVLLRSGASDSASRYETMEDMLAHLALLQAGESIRTSMRLARWWRGLKKYAAWLVLLLLLGVFSSWQILQLSRQSGELRERRVGSYLAYGSAAVDNHDYFEALPWFAAALELEQDDRERDLKHRLRIGSTLAASPRLIQIWEGFTNASTARFSAEGPWVIVPDNTSNLLTLDIASGRPVRQVSLGINKDDHVILSPNGRLALTYGTSGVWLWDATNGRKLRSLGWPADEGSEICAAFSSGGEAVALACKAGGAVQVWSCLSGERLWEYDWKGAAIEDLAWDNAGKLLVVCSRTHGVTVLNSGRVVTNFSKHILNDQATWVYAATFAPGDEMVATAGHDRSARLWSAESKQQFADFKHEGAVSAVAFSPNGKLLITGASDSLARIFDVAEGRLAGPPLPQENKVVHVSFSPSSGRYVLTASIEGVIQVWEYEVSDHPWSAQSLNASGNGQYLAWCEDANVVVIKNTAKESPERRTTPLGAVNSLLFDWDGHYLLLVCNQPSSKSGDPQAEVLLWNASTGLPAGKTFTIPTNSNLRALSPDGQQLAMLHDQSLLVWNTTTGDLLARASLQSTNPVCLAWHPFAKRVAFGAGTKVQVYDVAGGRFLWSEPIEHSLSISAISFSRDGRLVATACTDKTTMPGDAAIWDADGKAARGPVIHHKDGVRDVAFSPDGQWVATASEDFTAMVREVATGNVLGRRLRHPDEVYSVSFGSKHPWLVTSCRNGAARVWDVQTSEPLTPPLVPPIHPPARLARVRFVADDQALLMEASDGSRWLWKLNFDNRSPEELRRWARVLSAERSGPVTPTESKGLPSLAEDFARLKTLPARTNALHK